MRRSLSLCKAFHKVYSFDCMGIGLGEVTGRYEVIGALILIAIGVGCLIRGFFQGS